MSKVTKKRLLELLDQGATIDYTSWGSTPSIFVRLDKEGVHIFESVHISSFFAVKDSLTIVKRKCLTTVYEKKDSK